MSDVLLAVILLVMFSPIMAFISFLIYFKQGKQIIFKQKRLGINHRSFFIYKYCTMTNEVDSSGNLLPDNRRTTNLGQFLRKTSLDELPSLFNTLKGDMSFVGPRPLPLRYKHRYSKEQDRRHTVKPGITGWAQINGRNTISWNKKFKLDVWYVDNYSFILDLKVILFTIEKVLLKKDILPKDKDEMEEFHGKP